MPYVGDRLAIRNPNPYVPATELHHKPDPSTVSDADAVYVRNWATGGQGRTVAVFSDNEDAAAVHVQGAGSLLRLYNAASDLKFEVANDGTVTMSGELAVATLSTTGDLEVGGELNVTGDTILGAALDVTGASEFTGAVTLTGGITGDSTLTGDFTIQGTGKAYRFRRGGGALDLEGTGSDLLISNWSGGAFDGTQRSYFRLSADAQNVQVAGKVEFVDALYGATRHVIDGAANTIGFFGTAAAAKQTVTGADAATIVASVVDALVAYGLVVDGTT